MFNNISDAELNQLTDAIPLITILIAGVDGNIDNKEKEWAKKLTEIRSFAHEEDLQPYYEKVGDEFESKLENYITEYEGDTNARNNAITEKLKSLNTILPKLNNKIGYKLYDSFVSFAEHVAKASGGFMRFASISAEESKLIELPMISPIYLQEEAED